MPSEMRKLIFTTDELREALINYALRTQRRLPAASIERVVIAKTAGITATFVYAPLDGNSPSSIEFDETNIAAAIILYCRTRDIPLPRRGRKILTPFDESVAMLVQIDHPDPSVGTSPAPAPVLRKDANNEGKLAEETDENSVAAGQTAARALEDG